MVEKDNRAKKFEDAQKRIEDVLRKEFAGEDFAFWLFVARREENNVTASFASKMSFDKNAPLAVWQVFASGLQKHLQNVINDFRPPEMVAALPKNVDRGTA